jgi:hypothetical protein
MTHTDADRSTESQLSVCPLVFADYQHHQPPAHGGDLRPRHSMRPPLTRRWRRARLPPTLGLDGPR